MSWEPTRRRWWKQYRGRRFVVSCAQLGTPATKEASYRACNQWWVARKAEIDQTRAETAQATRVVSLSYLPTDAPDPVELPAFLDRTLVLGCSHRQTKNFPARPRTPPGTSPVAFAQIRGALDWVG